MITAKALYDGTEWDSVDDYCNVMAHVEATTDALCALRAILRGLPCFNEQQQRTLTDAVEHLTHYVQNLSNQGEDM